MTSFGLGISTFDVWVYALRDAVGNLERILCVHVDDEIRGGSGPSITTETVALRRRFPFRKWQSGEGVACYLKYGQNKDNKRDLDFSDWVYYGRCRKENERTSCRPG